MPSNHLILCRHLLLPLIFPSIRVFSNESVPHISWSKHWSFIFSISPSNEYSGLISFRIDWLDLLVVQGTLKCLVQYHSSKASILQHSTFFIVQLSYPYMTTGKTIALTRWTFRRWQGKRMYTHLLLRELQNYHSLLNNHRLENVGSHLKKIPHTQRQRRSPSKTVGGVKSHLDSNPIPTRELRGLKQNIRIRTQGPQKRLSQTCL